MLRIMPIFQNGLFNGLSILDNFSLLTMLTVFCCVNFVPFLFPSLPVPMCTGLNFDSTIAWHFFSFVHNLCLMNCIQMIMICDARSSIVWYFPISEAIRTWYQFCDIIQHSWFAVSDIFSQIERFANGAEKCKCEHGIFSGIDGLCCCCVCSPLPNMIAWHFKWIS